MDDDRCWISNHSQCLLVSFKIMMIYLNNFQISECDPFISNQSVICMSAESAYQLEIVAFVGGIEYTSAISQSAIYSTSLSLTQTHVADVTSTSFTVQWTPPDISVSGYRVWIVKGSDHNGYLPYLSTKLIFDTEIRLPGLQQRQIIANSSQFVHIFGCFATESGGSHCLQPWTYYRIYVMPFTLAFDGVPSFLTVLTAAALPLAPSNLTIVR